MLQYQYSIGDSWSFAQDSEYLRKFSLISSVFAPHLSSHRRTHFFYLSFLAELNHSAIECNWSECFCLYKSHFNRKINLCLWWWYHRDGTSTKDNHGTKGCVGSANVVGLQWQLEAVVMVVCCPRNGGSIGPIGLGVGGRQHIVEVAMLINRWLSQWMCMWLYWSESRWLVLAQGVDDWSSKQTKWGGPWPTLCPAHWDQVVILIKIFKYILDEIKKN